MKDDPRRDDPRKWDLDMAVFQNEKGTVALVEALRRYGAMSVEFGYVWPEGDFSDPVPGADLTWFAEAVFKGPLGLPVARREEVVGGPTSGKPHDHACHEALAQLVRDCGGKVQLVYG